MAPAADSTPNSPSLSLTRSRLGRLTRLLQTKMVRIWYALVVVFARGELVKASESEQGVST